MSYESFDSMSEPPLSKNNINTIRRSQVWAHCISSLISPYLYTFAGSSYLPVLTM